METSILRGTKAYHLSGFCYPKVVETIISFKDLCKSLCSDYPLSQADDVELKYFDSSEQKFVPLTCDEHVEILFAMNAPSRFRKIQIDVLQPPKNLEKGKGAAPDNSANSERPRTPRRSGPATPTGSEIQASAAVDVEDDAQPDEVVPQNDDEDERMYPELVDEFNKQAMED
jgi:hypothetical protein